MVLLTLIAAVAGAAPAAAATAPDRIAIATQATATVRVLSGERIAAGSLPRTAIVSDTKVRGADGVERSARLVEFP